MNIWQLDWRVDQTAVIKDGPGTFEVIAVGTKRHQQVLTEIAGQQADRGALVREAVLQIDNDNPNDSYAVTVLIDNRIVGSLSWPHALRFRDLLSGHRRLLSARCDAAILSPTDTGDADERWFRVALDLPRPAPPEPEPEPYDATDHDNETAEPVELEAEEEFEDEAEEEGEEEEIDEA